MAKLTIIEAVNLALKQEMKKDKTVLVLGEDIGIDGGVFRATEGLLKKFGEERVIDTPLSESGIIGTSIGLALGGFKPVAEIQFDGFLYPALDQLISHAARFRTRSRGTLSCPLVVRAPYSGGIRALEHHSESMEALFRHIPGLKVVIPSTPYDTKGLLLSAIRDPDPVIFLEPKRIYRAIREDVPEKEYTLPLGKANIVHDGSDITVVSYGSSMHETKKAVAELASDFSIELLDLRTISPLDDETVVASVKKTGRCAIVHEGPRSCGVAAELISRINEKALLSLEAPIVRVTGFDTIMPLYKLEWNYLPTVERIKKGILQALSF
ncbi:MAG TPA: alpha-ketoacid dehydrogenase subunit beta [Candidatus Nanoarchaeia archaeon]|nr:alpha-ketoacid dehydrogenase subunit beta [Candidatus Nanoarchaeia archaeon]